MDDRDLLTNAIRQIFGDGAAERALDTLRIPVVTVDGTVAA